MTIQSQVSVQSQVSSFIPRDYQIFAGLDVDKRSIAVTFCDHDELLRSRRLHPTFDSINQVTKHAPAAPVQRLFAAFRF